MRGRVATFLGERRRILEVASAVKCNIHFASRVCFCRSRHRDRAQQIPCCISKGGLIGVDNRVPTSNIKVVDEEEKLIFVVGATLLCPEQLRGCRDVDVKVGDWRGMYPLAEVSLGKYRKSLLPTTDQVGRE